MLSLTTRCDILLLPGVIWVLAFGMLYGALNRFGITDLPPIDLNPHILFLVLIPILIFPASKKICLYHFRKLLSASTLLARGDILISAGIIALVTYFAFGLPLLEGMLIGTILSSTDTIAVGTILHKTKRKRKCLLRGNRYSTTILCLHSLHSWQQWSLPKAILHLFWVRANFPSISSSHFW